MQGKRPFSKFAKRDVSRKRRVNFRSRKAGFRNNNSDSFYAFVSSKLDLRMWMAFFVVLIALTWTFEANTNFLRTTVLNIAPHDAFDGMVTPIQFVPDWVHATATERESDYQNFPADKLIKLPEYNLQNLVVNDAGLEWGNPEHNQIRNQKITYAVVWGGNYMLDGIEGKGSHPAVDIKALPKTPVFAIANGIVEKVSFTQSGFGFHVVIGHYSVPDPDDGSKKTNLFSGYSHLSSIGVKEGDIVKKGQAIGEVGQTGTATTNHLHFQIDKDNAPWHLYWPFSADEARQNGLTFYEAVNAGLGLKNLQAYTISPMKYVQTYANWKVDPAEKNEPESAENANQENNPEPEIEVKPQPEQEQSTETSDKPNKEIITDALILPDSSGENEATNVARFEIDVLDKFTIVGQPARVAITVSDANGAKVETPIFSKSVPSVELTQPIGGLSLKLLESTDFTNGIATVLFTPSAEGEAKVKVKFKNFEILSASISALAEVRQSMAYRVEHDGLFRPGQIEEIRIVALDELALPTPKVYFGGTLDVSVPDDDGSYFAPKSSLAPEDFVQGVASLQFIPQNKDQYFILLALNGNRLFESELFISELTVGNAFADVRTNHPHYQAINMLHEKDIIAGYPDGTFKPENSVSRVESLKFIYKIAETPLADADDLPFSDVNTAEWYSNYLATAVVAGVVNGYPDKTFRPQQEVILAEFLKMMFNVLKTDVPPVGQGLVCKDVKADEWFAGYVEFAAKQGLISLDRNSECHPEQVLTRGEVAEIISRMVMLGE